MGYTALYRKFRPTRFSEIVGQEHIKKTLKNQLMHICLMEEEEQEKQLQQKF